MYYLGSITAASGGYYNNATGVSGVGTFAIPNTVKRLYLAYAGSGLTGLSFAFSTATGATSFMTALNGAPLPAPGTLAGPYRVVNGPGGNVLVGVYNSVGGFVAVKVWAAPGET